MNSNLFISKITTILISIKVKICFLKQFFYKHSMFITPNSMTAIHVVPKTIRCNKLICSWSPLCKIHRFDLCLVREFIETRISECIEKSYYLLCFFFFF